VGIEDYRVGKCPGLGLCKTSFPTIIPTPMIPFIRTLPILFLFSLFLPVSAADDPKEKKAEEKKPLKTPDPVSKNAKITIAGKEIPYTVTTGKIVLRDDEGEPKASIFHVSYVRDKTENEPDRPVMFAFNGGPGSSSVWLHLGILGPKRVSLPGDGTQPMTPPARLIENEYSILDVCDLVFIDPVSTGYSRVEKKGEAKDYYGIEGDIKSVGEFIRKWISENKRWDSPKYLCGESYGGIRAAGLAEHLQNRYGMSLNGVVLLSSLLDYRTLLPAQGSQLSHQVFLPAFMTTAHYHKQIEGDREALLKEVREFAFGEYTLALLKGTAISEDELAVVSGKLEKFTSLPADFWKRKNLRINPSEFRAELLREEGKVVGRFDSRVAWDATNSEADFATYDPSYSLAIGAFSTAMLSYLVEDLGWNEEEHYEVLTSKVHPWRYDSDNRVVNLTDRLVSAIRDNPKLEILVMGAYADLATPPAGVPYSFSQSMSFPKPLRDQISYTYYEAGHMFYLNPPDLVKSRADLVEFLKKN
tara:strand:- start:10863 stop:12449 length:1587 start_codon:yes stop_codon:yes gene_type:complete